MSERATKNDKLSNREHFLKCCDEGEIFEDKSTWKIVSKPKAVSEHWNHFKIFSNERYKEYAVCKICYDFVKISGGTRNISAHFQNKHTKDLKEELERKFENEVSTSKQGSTKSITKYFAKDNQSRFVSAITWFLNESKASPDILELQSFKTMIKLAKNDVKIPSKDVIYNKEIVLSAAVKVNYIYIYIFTPIYIFLIIGRNKK